MTHHADEAIRELVKGASLGAIEYVLELQKGGMSPRQIFEMRDDLADQLAEIAMQCADESPESEVHAVRALAGVR